MEALADFGAVNLLNYRAMTDAIYRVWYGAFDRAAALQLATVLVSLTRRAGAARADAARPRPLPRRAGARRGGRAAAAARAARMARRRLPVVLLALVLVGPLVQLARLVGAVARRGRGGAGAAARPR